MVAPFFVSVGSRLLWVPVLAVGGIVTGAVYTSYTTARWSSGSLLSVDYDRASSTCQWTASAVAAPTVVGFFAYRHYKHEPPQLHTVLPTGLPPISVTSTVSSRIADSLRAYLPTVRFYSVNVIAGSIIMGVATSVAQRIICGKTPLTLDQQRNLKQTNGETKAKAVV